MTRAAFLFCISLLTLGRSNTFAQDRHVVLIVWDGMRPDFVSEKYSPTLWKLARRGVIFGHHHASYLSATDVNGVSMATGCYPAKTGIIANYVFRPEIDANKMIESADPVVVQKGDAVTGGKYLSLPTIAEILHQAGKRTAIAGTKNVALLQDRRLSHDNSARKSFLFFQGRALPNEQMDVFRQLLGPFPGLADAHADDWTTKALTDVMWKEGVPEFSLLWLSQPDDAQHKTAPGSPASIAAIDTTDKHLADVLRVLEQKGVEATTDVFVVSDHGFSTIEKSIDLVSELNHAGFHASTERPANPAKEDILVVGNGGTVFFYLLDHSPELSARLISWLQQTSFTGVIFSRQKTEGAFDMSAALIDAADVPDIVMAFRWNADLNKFGVPGMIDGDWNRAAGGGAHATLSAFDMHNTLVAAGPDLKQGMVDQLPSGNIDLVPTILHLLHVDTSQKFDGRILSEALVHPSAIPDKVKEESLEARRDLGEYSWRQYLKISHMGSTTYLDEGNGSSRPILRP